jgi:hypothetical protein
MNYFFVEVSLFFLIAALAFRLGDATERTSALVLIGQMSISIVVAFGFGTGRLPARNWVSSTTDAVVLVFLLLVVARSQKIWPPVAAGFQLAALVQDLRISTRLSPYDFAHVTYIVVWGWCVLLSLFLGILIQKGRLFAWLPGINVARRQGLGPKDITP